MGLEVLGHAEGLDLLLAEDGGHEFVGGEELLVRMTDAFLSH